jgi:hypothetical protein
MPRAPRLARPIADAAVRWQRVTSQAGAFTVSMPGPPAEDRQRIDTASGPVDFVILTVAEGDAVYAVAWGDYPAAAGRLKPARVLDDARDRALARGSGRLVAERPIDFDGNPGRELEVQTHPAADATLVSRVRLILVGSRL